MSKAEMLEYVKAHGVASCIHDPYTPTETEYPELTLLVHSNHMALVFLSPTSLALLAEHPATSVDFSADALAAAHVSGKRKHGCKWLKKGSTIATLRGPELVVRCPVKARLIEYNPSFLEDTSSYVAIIDTRR